MMDFSKTKAFDRFRVADPVAAKEMKSETVAKHGTSLNKSTVNSLHTYDLGNGVSVTVETQTGLCNVTKFMRSVKETDLRGNTKMSKWKETKKAQQKFIQFDEEHKNETVRVYNGTEVVQMDVVSSMISGKGTKNPVLWLHKELMVFYVDWVYTGGVTLAFAREVFDTKLAYLRDKGAAAHKAFSYQLNKLKYDDTDGGMIGPRFSNKLSKLVFGFNDDKLNQWDAATADQLFARSILLARFSGMITASGFTKWSELQNEMNILGKSLWLYWSGSAGKRRLRNENMLDSLI